MGSRCIVSRPGGNSTPFVWLPQEAASRWDSLEVSAESTKQKRKRRAAVLSCLNLLSSSFLSCAVVTCLVCCFVIRIGRAYVISQALAQVQAQCGLDGRQRTEPYGVPSHIIFGGTLNMELRMET